jgi:hypothetical protein
MRNIRVTKGRSLATIGAGARRLTSCSRSPPHRTTQGYLGKPPAGRGGGANFESPRQEPQRAAMIPPHQPLTPPPPGTARQALARRIGWFEANRAVFRRATQRLSIRLSGCLEKTGGRRRGGRKFGDRLRNYSDFAGRPRRTLSHEPCIPLFQQVCVTPRTSPVTPPWKVGGRVLVMAVLVRGVASALALAVSFG